MKSFSDIEAKFSEFLKSNKIPESYHYSYKKWLRYYLDFCFKYKHNSIDNISISPFINKLKQKKQTEQQCNQANKAIRLYLTMLKHNETSFKINDVLKSCPELNIEKILNHEINSKKEYHKKWNAVKETMKNEIKLRNYSPKTLKAYIHWANNFEQFYKDKKPEDLDTLDFRKYLEYLAVEVKVSASSQDQAFNALKKKLGNLKSIPRTKKGKSIPTVLSFEEVESLLKHLNYPFILVVKLLYGCGLRLNEAITLRIHNFNFDTGMLSIQFGKGKKSRTIPLPKTILCEIKDHFERVKNLYRQDLDNGFDGVFMPEGIERKYPNAAKELIWQWFFPAQNLTQVKDSGEMRRYLIYIKIFRRTIPLQCLF